MDLPCISETSSSESVTRLLSAHRDALQKASRKYFPYLDLDEFSNKLRKSCDRESSGLSISSASCVTFEPQKIYTIEEVTEDSRISIRGGERVTSSAEELKERIERLKRISSTARNSTRPESRRGTAHKPKLIELAARISYHEEIVQKFEIIDRFLKDQMDLKQDSIENEVFVLRRYSRSKSTPDKNRVIRSLCCSCISGE